MGAPSSIFSEIVYLQHLENTKTFDILLEHYIIGYLHYVDDVLIVYKNYTTNIYGVINLFNNVTPTINFTMEEENGNKINFLDVTISKGENNISFNIYRKPTTTGPVIPTGSCNPLEHELQQ
jgi:hypothetical protein